MVRPRYRGRCCVWLVVGGARMQGGSLAAPGRGGGGNGGGGAPSVVMVKEVQRDIFRRHPIHVDFHAISLTDRMEFHVPVLLKGIAKGIAEGGVVEQHLRNVAVECLPTEIPA